MPLYTVCLENKDSNKKKQLTRNKRRFISLSSSKKSRKIYKGKSLTVLLNSKSEKKKTMNDTTKILNQTRKIPLKKKKAFLTKQGVLRNGNATPEKVVDTLMYVVTN